MGIDFLRFKNANPMYNVQKVQGVQNTQQFQNTNSSTAAASSGSSLVERLNSMDNKLNQGGGVSLSSNAGQLAGQDDLLKKHKFM